MYSKRKSRDFRAQTHRLLRHSLSVSFGAVFVILSMVSIIGSTVSAAPVCPADPPGLAGPTNIAGQTNVCWKNTTNGTTVCPLGGKVGTTGRSTVCTYAPVEAGSADTVKCNGNDTAVGTYCAVEPDPATKGCDNDHIIRVIGTPPHEMCVNKATVSTVGGGTNTTGDPVKTTAADDGVVRSDEKGVCPNGATTAIPKSDCSTALPGQTLMTSCPKGSCIFEKYINPAINALAAIVGIAVTISIIVGGIRYATSADNPQKVSEAKQRILTSVMVLLGFFLLYAFLNYIIPGGLLT